MNQHFSIRVLVLSAVVVALAGLLLAQRTSNKVLVVNGRTSEAAVLQISGRSYVDVETLAQITNGSISFQENRIILTIPESGATGLGGASKLSKEFVNAALVELALTREWKSAIETMIRLQAPAVGPWFQDYHDRTEESLGLAKVAASSAPDQAALPLLENEFALLAQWAGTAVETRQALNATRTLSPTVLQDDLVLQKISNCAQFLSTMLVSGTFADNSSCH